MAKKSDYAKMLEAMSPAELKAFREMKRAAAERHKAKKAREAAPKRKPKKKSNVFAITAIDPKADFEIALPPGDNIQTRLLARKAELDASMAQLAAKQDEFSQLAAQKIAFDKEFVIVQAALEMIADIETKLSKKA